MSQRADDAKKWPVLSPLRTGILGRCPRCGKGRLFQGFLELRPPAKSAALIFHSRIQPTVRLSSSCAFSAFRLFSSRSGSITPYAPPLWVHLVTSLPVLLISCILPLRPLKGWLVASQYVYKAEEGRFERSSQDGDSPA